jgi:hypothetical protein
MQTTLSLSSLSPSLSSARAHTQTHTHTHQTGKLGFKISSPKEWASNISREVIFTRLRLKCDGTCAETRFRLSAKRTSRCKSAGASVQSTTGSRGVCINGSNAGYTMFRGCVKGTGCPHHSPVPTSLPLPCVTVCQHISTGLYVQFLLAFRSGRRKCGSTFNCNTPSSNLFLFPLQHVPRNLC